MSAPDEFDPFIERLYARTPPMPDADIFTAGVARRMARGSGVRTAVLSLAGMIGGVVAVRETLGSNLIINAGDVAESGVRAADTGLSSVSAQGQAAVMSGLEQIGATPLLEAGVMGGMTLFWAVAAGVVALATLAALKLAGQA